MKQTHKITLHSVFHLLLFGAVILAVASLHLPQNAQPTQPARPPASAPNVISANPKQTARIITANATSKQSHIMTAAVNSPKAAVIKAAVKHEYVYHMFAAPNDPQYANEWQLTKDNAPTAWNIATGSSQTVVAVIDTGFGLNHEDLVNRWYQNPGETGMTKPGDRCWTGTPQNKATNNCDDDGNGYVDDWRGWSFVNNDNNPQAGRQNSSGAGISHATEVSGLVGAETNNSTGIAALDWNTKIMPLQVLDDTGTGYTSDVTAAVYYAVDNGAQVINMSLGAAENDPAMLTAINYATAHNVVVVAAAGNCGDNSDPSCAGYPVGSIAYPASYPDVIAVGATTQSDQRASFSSYGPALDISAPGYDLPVSTSWSSGNQTSLYSTDLYGTSFASPQVASLVALIKSIRPSTSVADITAIIDGTATKPSTMSGLVYSEQLGHGIINAGAALSIAMTLNNTPTNVPVLMQAGSYKAELSAPAGSSIGSGCQATAGSACTVQLTGSSGYTRYLPYTVMGQSGTTGWTWSADMLESDNWAIRTRTGESISTTPYYLFKKG